MNQGIQSNKQQGTIAEAQVVVTLLQQGFGASWAVGDNVAWDVVSDWHGTVSRLQFKTTTRRASCGTWRVLCGHGRKAKARYEKADADAVICVLPWAMFVVPTDRLDHLTLTFWKPGEHPRYKHKKYHQCKYEWAKERWDLLK